MFWGGRGKFFHPPCHDASVAIWIYLLISWLELMVEFYMKFLERVELGLEKKLVKFDEISNDQVTYWDPC